MNVNTCGKICKELSANKGPWLACFLNWFAKSAWLKRAKDGRVYQCLSCVHPFQFQPSSIIHVYPFLRRGFQQVQGHVTMLSPMWSFFLTFLRWISCSRKSWPDTLQISLNNNKRRQFWHVLTPKPNAIRRYESEACFMNMCQNPLSMESPDEKTGHTITISEHVYCERTRVRAHWLL